LEVDYFVTLKPKGLSYSFDTSRDFVLTSPKGFSASKCDEGNWIFSKSYKFFENFFWKYFGFFWYFFGNFLGGFFWRNFLGGIFWEKFFGRIFLGGFFWEDFFGRIFLGGFFWEDFLRGILSEELLRRN
jgi:hypothetical protein